MNDRHAACAYGFEDLFEAAFGRSAYSEELARFALASREEVNAIVREWAIRAGWNAEDQVGTDGHLYTAFYPKQQ